MDLWSDLTVALDLAFGRTTTLGLLSALFFFCVASPVDFANLCMRIGYSLEDLPDRSHLLNIIFEIPMLAFNLFLAFGCVPMSWIWPTSYPGLSALGADHLPFETGRTNSWQSHPTVLCRPVPSAGKIGGYLSVVFTFTTLINASLMFFFKPEVLKYRAVVGHMVVKVGQKVGKAVTRGLGDFVPSELLSSPDHRATKDVDQKSASMPVRHETAPRSFTQLVIETLRLEQHNTLLASMELRQALTILS